MAHLRYSNIHAVSPFQTSKRGKIMEITDHQMEEINTQDDLWKCIKLTQKWVVYHLGHMKKNTYIKKPRNSAKKPCKSFAERNTTSDF